MMDIKVVTENQQASFLFSFMVFDNTKSNVMMN